MRCAWNQLIIITIATICKSTTVAFVPSSFPKTSSSIAFVGQQRNDDASLTVLQMQQPKNTDWMKRGLTIASLVTSLWISPLMPFVNEGMTAANAREMASGSGSRVNKDPESLLRYGLPIQNKEVRQLQGTIEDIRYDVASKRKNAALDGVKKTKTIITKSSSKLIDACRSDAKQECSGILTTISNDLLPSLEKAVKDSTAASQGSEQERQALDRAYDVQSQVIAKVDTLECDMVPANYKMNVPDIYDDLPQLQGRATVEFILEKPNPNQPFDVNGENFAQAKMTMIIDGYASPITSGNFIDLVNKGFYNNMAIQRSDGFVVQTGKPNDGSEGYTGGRPSKSVGAGPKGERQIPLEITIRGDSAPLYEVTMEDEGRGGEATVLPFSSFGAMGWARDEYEVNSGSSQFFWLLFDSDLTPAGKNVLDGRYPCFGYVIKGNDFLKDIKEGDIIKSAKVTEGLDKLVLPKTEN